MCHWDVIAPVGTQGIRVPDQISTLLIRVLISARIVAGGAAECQSACRGRPGSTLRAAPDRRRCPTAVRPSARCRWPTRLTEAACDAAIGRGSQTRRAKSSFESSRPRNVRRTRPSDVSSTRPCSAAHPNASIRSTAAAARDAASETEPKEQAPRRRPPSRPRARSRRAAASGRRRTEGRAPPATRRGAPRSSVGWPRRTSARPDPPRHTVAVPSRRGCAGSGGPGGPSSRARTTDSRWHREARRPGRRHPPPDPRPAGAGSDAPPTCAGWRGEMVAGRPGDALGIRVVERQPVGGDVIRTERQRLLERLGPAREGLARDVVQEVEAQAGDARLARSGHGGRDIVRSVPPAERPQLVRSEALRADREPRDAGAGQGREVAAIVGPGVRLEGNLGPGGEPIAGPDLLDEPRNRLGGQQRRRAPAEVDRLERPAARRLPDRRRTRRARRRAGPARLPPRAGRGSPGFAGPPPRRRRRPRNRNRGTASGRTGRGCRGRRGAGAAGAGASPVVIAPPEPPRRTAPPGASRRASAGTPRSPPSPLRGERAGRRGRCTRRRRSE